MSCPGLTRAFMTTELRRAAHFCLCRLFFRRRDVIQPRAGDAGDQARAALERDVVPQPVQRDDGAFSKTDQKLDVRYAPEYTRVETGEPQAAYFHHGELPSDGRERAEIHPQRTVAVENKHFAVG